MVEKRLIGMGVSDWKCRALAVWDNVVIGTLLRGEEIDVSSGL